jgi:hypothetical protein
MRRHLVVVCGVTAAVLLAGGIAATTAGADTAPEIPGLPALDMPDVPGIPQLPADGDADTVPGQDDSGVPDQGAQQASQHDGHQTQNETPHRPGGTTASTSDGDGHSLTMTTAGAAPTTMAGRLPAAARGHASGDPHAGGPARPATQKAATTLAAAQRDVSPTSASTSPAAPVQQQVLALVNQNRRRAAATTCRSTAA